MNILGGIKRNSTFDAIVVGSGISGGWAAMELCKKGLKVLLLERGRNVEHVKDYPTANLSPWDFKFRLHHTEAERMANPISTQYSDAADQHFYARDSEHPYIQKNPFNWVRGYQVGGRSLTWGRQCYRLSDLDFEANLKESIAVDWPIRYKDIAPWYDYVERFIGVSGKKEGLSHLPDGCFLPAMELNCIEQHLDEMLRKSYPDRLLTIARVANLTKELHGRGACQNRNLCTRGCPYGAYFSSNSATLPLAFETGNLTLRPHSVVSEIMYDDSQQRATGVRVIDALSGDYLEYYAKVVFVNASTIGTASLLLNSKSARYPSGLGNDSGELGHNLMDHHSAAGASAFHTGFSHRYYKGRRPSGFIIPRFRNLNPNEKTDFLRGYNIQGKGERQGWDNKMNLPGFGDSFKQELTRPGHWQIWMGGWGECLPYHENKISLHPDQTDKWGIPLIVVNFAFGSNEDKMMDDIRDSCQEIFERAGFSGIDKFIYRKPGGSTIHEMGTARMGHNAETSVLNANNQLHKVKNVFITDGSCMTSSGCQNPSLTYMALTARACDYAVAEMKKKAF